jgi:hypothetical protein
MVRDFNAIPSTLCLLQCDLYINTGRQIEAHQSVYCFIGGVNGFVLGVVIPLVVGLFCLAFNQLTGNEGEYMYPLSMLLWNLLVPLCTVAGIGLGIYYGARAQI